MNHQEKKKKHSVYIIAFAIWLSSLGICANASECDQPRPEWVLCDDFESGNFSKWTAVYNSSVILNTPNPSDAELLPASPTRQGAGIRVAQLHYVIPVSAPIHHDDNKFLYLNLPQMTDHLFIRGYVLIPNSTTLYGTTRAIQRKLIYLKSNLDPASGTAEHNAFGFFLTSEPRNRSDQYVTLRLGYGGRGGTGASLEGIGSLTRGQWTALQMEVKLNSPSTASEVSPRDGLFRLWIDNMLVYEKLDMDYRSNDPNSPRSTDAGKSAAFMLDMVEVGRQADRLEYDPVDEYRYWDNIVISTQYIPQDQGQVAPSPPQALIVR